MKPRTYQLIERAVEPPNFVKCSCCGGTVARTYHMGWMAPFTVIEGSVLIPDEDD